MKKDVARKQASKIKEGFPFYHVRSKILGRLPGGESKY